MEELLFTQDLRQQLDRRLGDARAAAQRADVTEASFHDDCDRLTNRFRLTPPEVDRVGASVRIEDAQIPRGPLSIPGPPLNGQRVTLDVPIAGDIDLLRCQPSQFNLNPPRGSISGSRVSFVLEEGLQLSDSEALRRRREEALDRLGPFLSWIATDIGSFNGSLETEVRSAVSERLGQLRARQEALRTLNE
jgi:hypothetical protein